MLEAIFGGLFSFALKLGQQLLETAVEAITSAFGSRQERTGISSVRNAASNLQDIAGEITGREKSIARKPNAADDQALEQLRQERAKALLEYQEAQGNAAAAELAAAPGSFTQSVLSPGGENKLLYHVGLVTLKKVCPACSRAMKLQHKTVEFPQFSDFFWQCTGFYDNEQCRRTETFRPADLTLLHKSDIPEIEIPNADLIAIASDRSVQGSTDRRIASHLGETDADVLCPVHATPMVLREKQGPDGMPLLDKYHLRCSQYPCSQTTKLKSYPQLAAFLRRKDGAGILH